MATAKKIATCVGVWCEAFNRPPTAVGFKAAELALAGIGEDLLDAATNAALVASRDFMPTPGQLRELAVTGGIGYAARAERAWLEFDRAVVVHGADRSVSFTDGLINATVRLCGDWQFCCGRVGDDYGVWLKKLFIEPYQRLCVGGAPEDLRLPLVGNLERENAHQFGPAKMREFQKQFPRTNTGQVVSIGTAQPVLLPPSEPAKRIGNRPGEVPQIEFRKV